MKSSNKKILVTCDGFLPPKVKVSGGKNIYLIQKFLSVKGFDMHLAVFLDKRTSENWRGWVKEEEGKFNIKFHVINIPFKGIYALHFFLKKFLSFFIFMYLQIVNKFDLIHEYSSVPFLVNMTYLLGRPTGAKSVHTLCTVNKGIFGSGKLALKSSDSLICTSENIKNRLEDRLKKTAKLIPIPIDDIFYDLPGRKADKAQFGVKTDKAVLFSGPLDAQKGIATFLSAIPKILEDNQDTSVIILTPPGLNALPICLCNKKKIVPLINSYNGRLIFIEKEVDILSLFLAADVYVYPLLTMHGTLGTPSMLIEAMAMGKAIVASRLPELKGIIQDEKNALFFKPGHSYELTQKVNRLLIDQRLRNRLGQQAGLDTQEYKLSKVADKIEHLYDELLADF